MKKNIFIIALCALITGCGLNNADSTNYQAEKTASLTEAFTQDNTEYTEEETTAITETAATEVCTETFTAETAPEFTEPLSVTLLTTTETFVKLTETDNVKVTGKVRSAEKDRNTPETYNVKTAETAKNYYTSESTVRTTAATQTAITTVKPVQTQPKPEETMTEPTEAETQPHESSKSDYKKALYIYNYVRANCGGTCVQHSYMAYGMCRSEGLGCYFIWTEDGIYGHVANAVKVDGSWYVMDTQAGGFLIANDCGFTEIVDENENHIAGADLISSYGY